MFNNRRSFSSLNLQQTSIWNQYNLKPAEALCEASKYFFYLRYESGPMYKPSTRDFPLTLQDVSQADAQRLRSIWNYWEEAVDEDAGGVAEDALHPDHRVGFA